MRILIADKFSSAGQETLRSLGHQVDFRPDLGAADLSGALKESSADLLIVRSTKVSAEAIQASDSLSLIIRAGAGVNTIDCEAASQKGVYVANCPGKNAIAVAELAFGLLLSLDRNIPAANRDLAEGLWNKKKYGNGHGIFGRTLGLIGLGAIASEVATRAKAFGMKVLVYSANITEERAAKVGATAMSDLDELLRQSDAISVHVPYRENTRHMIGARELGLLRDGAIVLHTARGGVIDDQALAKEVSAGRLKAGLDVFENEPGSGKADFEHCFQKLDGVCATPHIGASTDQSTHAIAEETIRIIRAFTERGEVLNAVNVVNDRPARFSLIVRHRDRVGVLAGILESLRREQLNVKEMQNIVFDGAEAAASATISLEKEPTAELLDQLRNGDNVLAVDLRSTAS